MSILLYGCTTWTLTKHYGNYTRMLRAILNKSWRQHSTKQQLYGPPYHLPPIRKTNQVWRTRHAGHCWRSKDDLILQWTPSSERAKVGRPARTYIQQLCADTGCRLDDLPGTMDDRDELRERVREIRAGGTTWWYIYQINNYSAYPKKLPNARLFNTK